MSTRRLTSSSLAGISRKLVAVGTSRLASMLVAMRAATPRIGSSVGAERVGLSARRPGAWAPGCRCPLVRAGVAGAGVAGAGAALGRRGRRPLAGAVGRPGPGPGTWTVPGSGSARSGGARGRRRWGGSRLGRSGHSGGGRWCRRWPGRRAGLGRGGRRRGRRRGGWGARRRLGPVAPLPGRPSRKTACHSSGTDRGLPRYWRYISSTSQELGPASWLESEPESGSKPGEASPSWSSAWRASVVTPSILQRRPRPVNEEVVANGMARLGSASCSWPPGTSTP